MGKESIRHLFVSGVIFSRKQKTNKLGALRIEASFFFGESFDMCDGFFFGSFKLKIGAVYGVDPRHRSSNRACLIKRPCREICVFFKIPSPQFAVVNQFRWKKCDNSVKSN